MRKYLLLPLFAAALFASCGERDDNSYLYIKNTRDEAITVTVSSMDRPGTLLPPINVIYSNQVIPAGAAAGFTVSDSDFIYDSDYSGYKFDRNLKSGAYRVNFFVTSNPAITGYAHVEFGYGGGRDGVSHFRVLVL